MRKIICSLAVACLTSFGAGHAAAELPTGSDPLLQCHRVFSEVGLIVRASASSEGRKVGSLKKGEKVQLDGEELAGTGAVYPQIKTDEEGGYWVKIKSPKAGYVLYTSEDDSAYRYIVPCK